MISEELVKQLKESKGVTFRIIDEKNAVSYIKDVNNYLRTASYRKNYVKHTLGENKGKYIDLDFAYLTELSTIDMHLRNILFKMCVDVEHAIKTQLIAAVENNSDEDGYSFVKDFFDEYSGIYHSIEEKADSIFTGQLIEKYFDLCYVFPSEDISKDTIMKTKILKQNCPVWVLVELLSFGDTIKLVNFYNRKYPDCKVNIPHNSILQPIKNLRNACAHNNCLLNNLNVGTTKPNHHISTYIASIKTIGKEERVKKLSCRPLFEIVCLLKTYSEIVSPKVKMYGLKALKDFADNRMFIHKSYYANNQVINTAFDFFKKVLDNLK